jgi:hypothetical protein
MSILRRSREAALRAAFGNAMSQEFRFLSYLYMPTTVVAAATLLVGCGDDLPDQVLTTTITTSGNDDADGGDDGDDDNDGGDFVDGEGEGGVDDTSDTGDETGPPVDGAPCDFDEEIDSEYDFAGPAEEVEVTLNGELDCDYENILVEPNTEGEENYLIPTNSFDIWVYHPTESDVSDAWPASHPLFPVVFMSPGANQQIFDGDHLYGPMMTSLASSGFVVIAIDPVSGSNWSSGRRRAALACAMIWARGSEEIAPHLANAMAIMGHSRGASAAWLLTNDLLSDPNTNLPEEEPAFDHWKQCATVAIAQRYSPASMSPAGDRTTTNVPIAVPVAPPFLGLYGAIDEDTTVQPITAFDNLYNESRVNYQGAPEQNDELFMSVYGYRHNTWGGTVFGADSLISPYYVPKFLRWQMLNEQEHRADLILPTAWDAAAGDFDTTIASSSAWTTGNNDIYYSGCEDTMMDPCPLGQGPLQGLGRPLIYADYTQGVTWDGANRFALDFMELGGPYCEDFDAEPDLPVSTMGGAVVAEATPGGDDPVVCQDSTTSLLTDRDIAHESFDAHETGAMLVQWGGDLAGTTIRWSLRKQGVTPTEISSATHLSFRIGNVLTEDEDTSCDEPLDEFTMSVELRDDYVLANALGPSVTITPVIDPQAVEIVGLNDGNRCRAAQFMHTVRVPLDEFCDDNRLAVDYLKELVFHFPDDDETHTALIDSLEFTHDPYLPGEDPHLGECPQAAASAWNCVADELVATRTSCSGEPISGECDIIDIEEDSVALPEVEIPNDTFEGWVVHIPKGWLRDPEDPTASELDDILERCVAACELEYADDPFVTANCSDTNAFLEPTLRNLDDIGALVSIADAHAHGEDLFVTETVDCDLRSDCSAAFDENLGPSRLRRPSPQSEPLHRGEEWLVTVIGDMEAGSSYAAMSLFSDASAAMGGTVGYSRCAPGNAPETCPFYLGSMDLELLEPLVLDLECDSVIVSHELTELTLRLAQPAFGVSEDGTTYNGFTPGGLLIEAEGVVDEIPFTSRRPIEQPVYVDAADGLLTMQGELDGFVLEFEIPCNGLMADVAVGWSLVEDAVLEGPPTLGIGHLPATMTCPDDLALTLAWASDPDSDYESLQWIVDGVLLEGESPTLAMTESHEITAVLRDTRGATGSATTTVACQ